MKSLTEWEINEAGLFVDFPNLESNPEWTIFARFKCDGTGSWRPIMGNMYGNSRGGAHIGWGLWIASGSTQLHWRAGSSAYNFDLNLVYNVWFQLAIVRKNNDLTFHLFNEATEEHPSYTNSWKSITAHNFVMFGTTWPDNNE